ncbi:hypothetical protein DER45DRAFT_276552 [Fusarium avenaceum]|nr:hypothetical protein DER45DRAFT_276552 [Fusarium avenaceum]
MFVQLALPFEGENRADSNAQQRRAVQCSTAQPRIHHDVALVVFAVILDQKGQKSHRHDAPFCDHATLQSPNKQTAITYLSNHNLAPKPPWCNFFSALSLCVHSPPQSPLSEPSPRAMLQHASRTWTRPLAWFWYWGYPPNIAYQMGVLTSSSFILSLLFLSLLSIHSHLVTSHMGICNLSNCFNC